MPSASPPEQGPAAAQGQRCVQQGGVCTLAHGLPWVTEEKGSLRGAASWGAGWYEARVARVGGGSLNRIGLRCCPLPCACASVSPGGRWGGKDGDRTVLSLFPEQLVLVGSPPSKGDGGPSVLPYSVLLSPALESWPGLQCWAVMSALGQGKRGRRLLPGGSPPGPGPHTWADRQREGQTA